ncbi:hypothetical protein J6590_064910 [Homalodisca vitripennis]|nr:hypothetical protein J6590_064910 [Homalodisca vitripennis]
MPQNRRVELPDCRVLLRRLSTEEIGNYLAVRDVRIAVNERPNNEAEINIVLPRGNNVNINDIVNPRFIALLPNLKHKIVAVPARNNCAYYSEFVAVPAKGILGISTVNLVPLGTPTILYRQMGKWKPSYKVVTKRVLLVTDSHGRELHHLLERSSEYAVTAIVSPNGTLNYIADNALLYQESYDEVIVMAGTNDINDQVTKRVLLVTDSHGRELHHLLERSSQYAVTAIVSPNGTLNYIADNALLYQESYDEVIVMAGTNDINDQGYINNDFFNALGKLIKLSKLNNLSIINLPRRRDTVSPAVHRARASLNATLKNINCANFIDNFKL